jgi:hypothetical protein
MEYLQGLQVGNLKRIWVLRVWVQLRPMGVEINLKTKQGVCHTVALPFTLKSIFRQKKNDGNSNISPCKNIIFKKSYKKEIKILQDIITL